MSRQWLLQAAFKRTSKYALVRSAAAVQAQAAASAITQRAAAQRLLRARATSTAAKRRSMRLVNTHCPAYCRYPCLLLASPPCHVLTVAHGPITCINMPSAALAVVLSEAIIANQVDE